MSTALDNLRRAAVAATLRHAAAELTAHWRDDAAAVYAAGVLELRAGSIEKPDDEILRTLVRIEAEVASDLRGKLRKVVITKLNGARETVEQNGNPYEIAWKADFNSVAFYFNGVEVGAIYKDS